MIYLCCFNTGNNLKREGENRVIEGVYNIYHQTFVWLNVAEIHH